MQTRDRRFQWIQWKDGKLYDVGILADGTVWNPNGYREAEVREAVSWAIAMKEKMQRESEIVLLNPSGTPIPPELEECLLTFLRKLVDERPKVN